MDIYLIRHGKTPGNVRKAYIGITDEPLTEDGVLELQSLPAYPETDLVYVTPLQRTQLTAEILFPGVKQHILPPMQEMDFGIFEGKNYVDLAENEDYRHWVDGNCEGVCPGGNGIIPFSKRVCDCLITTVNQAILDGKTSLTFVIHGGVIMSIGYCLCETKMDFYKWWTENGKCRHFTLNPTSWHKNPVLTLVDEVK